MTSAIRSRPGYKGSEWTTRCAKPFSGFACRGLTATYSHSGPEWDQKLRETVVRLDQAFNLSYGLSYERQPAAEDARA